MDKAVNFILHTERFDGQLLFNPRLAFTKTNSKTEVDAVVMK